MMVNFVRFFINLFQFNRTNWKAVTLCFLAATIFWLFNAFNKNYSANIRFPIHFEYDRDRYVPFDHLPTSLVMNVNGNGWDLFRKQFGMKVPELSIPIVRPLELKKFVGNSLPMLVANQVGSLQINYVITDTLYINLDEKDVHKFKVVADDRNISFKKGLGKISPIVVLPDSVTLEGPKRFLHQLKDTLVVTIPEQRVGNNFRQEVEVVIDNSEMIMRNPPFVEVIFEVGEVVQIDRKIKLQWTLAVNKSMRKLPQDSVGMQVEIPKNRMEDFQNKVGEIKATIDYKKEGTESAYPLPRVKNLPAYARLIKVDTVTSY